MLEHGSYSGDPVTKVLLQPLTGWSLGPGQRGCGGAAEDGQTRSRGAGAGPGLAALDLACSTVAQ